MSTHDDDDLLLLFALRSFGNSRELPARSDIRVVNDRSPSGNVRWPPVAT